MVDAACKTVMIRAVIKGGHGMDKKEIREINMEYNARYNIH